MPGKANASKKKSQQLKRNSKTKVGEEVELSEKKVMRISSLSFRIL
jgi:hypothetical protein